MRRELAAALRALARRLYRDDHHSTVEITDEYGICRCRLAITTDATHGIDSEFAELPRGWDFHSVEE